MNPAYLELSVNADSKHSQAFLWNFCFNASALVTDLAARHHLFRLSVLKVILRDEGHYDL